MHGSNQSVAEFYGQFYSNQDLAAFLTLSGQGPASIPPSSVYGDLPNNQSKPGGEAQLDVEYIIGMAPGAQTYFYSFSDLNPYNEANEGFLAYLYYVGSQVNPPLVHSISYGDVEANVFNASNPGSSSYGFRCDQQFMLMGLRGLTVVFSSGDDGIGNNIIRSDPELACSKAWPAWPASSPYVTSVGATQLTNSYLPACGTRYSTGISGLPDEEALLFECTGTGETVCSAIIGGVITSGGGFSDVSSRSLAPWQSSAVETFLANNGHTLPPAGYFNSTGRGYPDVATYGSNYFVVLDGKTGRESGTSASAPVFAAMVTLWNDIRLAYGKPPLGFISPFLYSVYAQSPNAFNDIITGNNACGVGKSIETTNCCNYSFSAVPGWDPVTGLGSPNFLTIANLVLNNQSLFPSISAFPDGVGIAPTSPSQAEQTANTIAIVALVISIVGLLAIFSFVILHYTFLKKRGLNLNDHTFHTVPAAEQSLIVNEEPYGVSPQQGGARINPISSRVYTDKSTGYNM